MVAKTTGREFLKMELPETLHVVGVGLRQESRMSVGDLVVRGREALAGVADYAAAMLRRQDAVPRTGLVVVSDSVIPERDRTVGVEYVDGRRTKAAYIEGGGEGNAHIFTLFDDRITRSYIIIGAGSRQRCSFYASDGETLLEFSFSDRAGWVGRVRSPAVAGQLMQQLRGHFPEGLNGYPKSEPIRNSRGEIVGSVDKSWPLILTLRGDRVWEPTPG